MALVTLQLFQRFHPQVAEGVEHHAVVILLQQVDQAVLAAVAVSDQVQLQAVDQETHHLFLLLKETTEVREKTAAQFLQVAAVELAQQVRQLYTLEHLEQVETV